MAGKEEGETAQQLGLAKQRVRNINVQNQRAALMLQELDKLEPDVRCYETCGRAYFLTTKAQLQETIKSTVDENVKKVEELSRTIEGFLKENSES
jgi:chaperonin cofactor prefoldin